MLLVRTLLALLTFCGLATAGESVDTRHAPFLTFESGPTQSLLRTRDGKRLLALNTTDHRVEVFRLPGTLPKFGSGPAQASSDPALLGGSPNGLLTFERAIFSGLEPVALVQHPTSDSVVFVSNHAGDTVAVIDLDLGSIIATLPVGDEPSGLAISGGRLLVACARTPVVPSPPGALDLGPQDENVVVTTSIDPPYAVLGHVSVHGMKPRDIAIAHGRAYVAIGVSGNHTTLLDETQTKSLGIDQTTLDAYDSPALPFNPVLRKPELNPIAFARGWYPPNAGRIVLDSEHPSLVPQLADHDVVAIDVGTLTLTPQGTTGVGTTLHSIAYDADTDRLWISNTDAHNRIRFEPRLRGGAVSNRVTILDPNGSIQKIIDLDAVAASGSALPGAITFSAEFAFIALCGSDRILVLDKRSGSWVRSIDVGSIPSGLAHDPKRNVLFVHCRGSNTIEVIEGRRLTAIGSPIRLSYDPEPPIVRAGRRHLYSARPDGHGNGTLACASCHISGHGDGLAWDLGDPGGSLSNYYPDVLKGLGSYEGELVVAPTTGIIHPWKGPMVTQSLRGLIDPDTKDDLPLHWRGDRRTFHSFRGAFPSLLGGTGIDLASTQRFAGFLRSLRYAPNPLQPRDRNYTGAAANGANLYGMNAAFSGKDYSAAVGVSCIDCHIGDFFEKDDFTGSRPVASAGSFTQLFQTAQLRMAYEKHSRALTGFGLLHDGAVDGVRGFLVDFKIPNGGGNPFHALDLTEKEAIANFVERFDHGLSPLIGAQFTLDASSLASAAAFLDLAEAQARPAGSLGPNLDLILKGHRIAPDGTVLPRGGVYAFDPATQTWGYRIDTGAFVDRATLVIAAQTLPSSFTFTCVPPGLGTRLGVDRDEDGAFDFVETSLALDPTDPDSDGDGSPDGEELAAHFSPHSSNEAPIDSTSPAFQSVRALEVGSESATISLLLDEPVHVMLTLGTTPGAHDIATIDSGATRRRHHELVAVDLPGGREIHVTVAATDRGGNSAVWTTSFRTLPPFFHVDSITLERSTAAPYTVTARIAITDAQGEPITGMPLVTFWSGDLGGQAWQRQGVTDSTGLATIAVTGLQPTSPTEVGVTVAWLGSLSEEHPYFVGRGGQTPSFYYDTTQNRAHYATVALP